MSKAEAFADRMHRIPRKVIHCEVYGTPKVVVDERHAANILRKVVPTATSVDIYHALGVLQDRLDDRV
jgi:hypothetical protein